MFNYHLINIIRGLFLYVRENLKLIFYDSSQSEIAIYYILANILGFAFLLRFRLAFDYLQKYDSGNKLRLSTGEVLNSIFSREIFCSRSFYIDVGILFSNLILFGIIAVLVSDYESGSGQFLTHLFNQILAYWPRHSLHFINPILENCIFTAILFLTYESLYYFSHRAFHRFSFLWQFHKVHHSATKLSFMTHCRFHAIEWLGLGIYERIAATLAQCLCVFFFGGFPRVLAFNGIMIHFAILNTLTLAQHSNLWLSFGKYDSLIISPAMHIFHHSKDPKHFDSNYALNLSPLDVLFGTFQKVSSTPPVGFEIGLEESQEEQEAWRLLSPLGHFIKPIELAVLSLKMFLRDQLKQSVSVK